MISLHVAICSSVHQGSMSTRPFEPRPRRDARLGDRDETETLGILSETRPRWDVAAPETLAKRYGENHWKWQNFIYGWTKLVSTMVSAFCFVILWVFLHRGSSNRSSFVSHGVCVLLLWFSCRIEVQTDHSEKKRWRCNQDVRRVFTTVVYNGASVGPTPATVQLVTTTSTTVSLRPNAKLLLAIGHWSHFLHCAETATTSMTADEVCF